MPEFDEAIDPSRRTLLRGVAVVGGLAVAGGTLAACGGGDDSSSGDDGSSKATKSPTTESPSSDASTDAPKSSGTDLGSVSAVAVGSGKIFKSKKVVVTQPAEGDFKAFTAVCTHQGCLVSKIVENTIVCPCHGSEYSIEDGSVIKGPASGPLAEKKVTTAGGKIVVS